MQVSWPSISVYPFSRVVAELVETMLSASAFFPSIWSFLLHKSQPTDEESFDNELRDPNLAVKQ